MSTGEDMKADDSAMVDDILNELNQNNTNVPENPVPEIITPPNNTENILNTNTPPERNINLDIQEKKNDDFLEKNNSKLDNILSLLKRPIVVISLAFILFHPITTNLLNKYLPTIFEKTISSNPQTVRVACLSLILGLIYLIIGYVL